MTAQRARPARRAALALAMALAMALAACGGGAAGPPAEGPEAGRPLSAPRSVPLFSYEAVGGQEISPATLAGRVSVIGFITTYDAASQAQARILAELQREHTPRLNVAVLALEPPANAPLVEIFAQSLRLPYPVALADAPTIAGEGPFAGLHHVPSVVILDRRGREVHRRVGLAPRAALEEIIREVERVDASGAEPALADPAPGSPANP
ncbi:MAG TPA: TlpA disulfide reductase family protein [Candidatus Nanopelagicales bacterium]|nr:TlpA disulfide reductase family protein [Candidatus Nanopelagicales bacterium]